MLDIVQMPLARRLWRISKFFQIPINDPRIQNLDTWDLDFYEYSMIADDPKKLEKLENHFSDPDWDDWVEEFELEQQLKQQSDDFNDVEMPDEETVRYAAENQNSVQESTLEHDEEFEESVSAEQVLDWEEVE